MRLTLAERFWSKVGKRDDPGECWEWLGSRDGYAYGRLWANLGQGPSRPTAAQRVSWVLHYGSIPDGLEVLHSCDHPWCVNPYHLFLGTQAANMKDMARKGRSCAGDRNGSRRHPERLARGERNGSRLHPESRRRGESHPNAKLTDSIVLDMRRRYAAGDATQEELASDYGVAQGLVSMIVHGKLWCHIREGTSC